MLWRAASLNLSMNRQRLDALDLTPNGAAVANVVGKNILLTTGDDSKMVVGVEGGGYQLVDGTPLTNKVFENIITEGVNDGTLSADLLDTFGIGGQCFNPPKNFKG